MFYSRTVRMIIVIFVNIIKVIYEPYKLEVQILHNVENSIMECAVGWIYSQVKARPANTTIPIIEMLLMV